MGHAAVAVAVYPETRETKRNYEMLLVKRPNRIAGPWYHGVQ